MMNYFDRKFLIFVVVVALTVRQPYLSVFFNLQLRIIAFRGDTTEYDEAFKAPKQIIFRWKYQH